MFLRTHQCFRLPRRLQFVSPSLRGRLLISYDFLSQHKMMHATSLSSVPPEAIMFGITINPKSDDLETYRVLVVVGHLIDVPAGVLPFQLHVHGIEDPLRLLHVGAGLDPP